VSIGNIFLEKYGKHSQNRIVEVSKQEVMKKHELTGGYYPPI
jgi:hypothetical protein